MSNWSGCAMRVATAVREPAAASRRCRLTSAPTSSYPRTRAPPARSTLSARVQKSRVPLLRPVSMLATLLRLMKTFDANSACMWPAASRSLAS
jgi:hypothetical protein